MSPFFQLRLFSASAIAIAFALLCINSCLASPVAIAGRPHVSIIAASEPVFIIPSQELPPGQPLRHGGSTTSNDGTTVTTTFNSGGDVERRANSLPVVSASAPVNIIPIGELPPGFQVPNGSSKTTDDGTTVTTTYTTGKTHNNRGTTDATGSLNLLDTKNQTLTNSQLSLGLNCEGSKIMCIGAAQMGVMHTLRDYTYAIPTGYRYYTGQDIACMKHNAYPNPWITWGFYCVFMQGNIPTTGVDGEVIQLKMQQMIEHHCLGCGSVPFSDDNDPNISGILTVNYVRQSECEGLCYYKPPGPAPNSSVKVPEGMVLVA